MKVYVLFDDIDKSIINIYLDKNMAQEDSTLCSNRSIREFQVIQKDVKMKSIIEVEDKVYDPKHMEDTMPFGKYQGQLISDLLFNDPRYLEWCVDNLNFSLDEECLNVLQSNIKENKNVR